MKKITIIFLVFLVILFALFKGAEWWVESKIQSAINQNPNRSYDITYEDLDFQTFFKGVILQTVRIVPLNTGSGTVINGSVNNARLTGLVWRDLAFSKKLDIDEISFEQPAFEITLSSDSTKRTSGKGMQSLFGDILSRAKLKRFRIRDGSVMLKEPESGKVVGQVKSLSVFANEIATDSMHWKHLIPFELGALTVEIDSAWANLNDYTQLALGALNYSLNDQSLVLKDLSMGYNTDWRDVSKKLGYQTDLMTVELDELAIIDLESSSSFYSDLDIIAKKLVIDGLNFGDHRDKNMPRPQDSIKPMFKGMIDGIPVSLKIDTIQLKDVNVSYTELGEAKTEAGTIQINDINGNITGLTTFPELQEEYQNFKVHLTARLQDAADMKVELQVPYDRETFAISAHIGPMDMSALSQTTKAMGGVIIESGNLSRIDLRMDATKTSSQNSLVMDYRNLKAEVVKDNKKQKDKKQVLLSAVANTAIRTSNMPGDKKYLTAKYSSVRNQYRGPFNFIWASTMDGIIRIVPGKGVQFALGVNKKDKKKK
ncbi:MAG: DUF748 domain-containing protein [Flavobacteriaceae bacterium]